MVKANGFIGGSMKKCRFAMLFSSGLMVQMVLRFMSYVHKKNNNHGFYE